MNREQKIAGTAMLAGKILLVGGADIFRVEDTMNRILENGRGHATAFVLATGITLTVECDGETVTLTQRVGDRQTNLNRIYEVNAVSRRLSEGKLTIDEAYAKFLEIERYRQYPSWLARLSLIGVCFGFAMLLGGNVYDCISAGLVGLILAVIHICIEHVGMNSFCLNAIYSFGIAAFSVLLSRYVFPKTSLDTIVISSIMPLVPGVTFTTAIRDTLNGDYTAGMARILEAIVIALAVATGVGAAMALY